MKQPELGKKIADLRKAQGLTQESHHQSDFIRWFNTGQVDSLLSNYSEEACVLGQGRIPNRMASKG